MTPNRAIYRIRKKFSDSGLSSAVINREEFGGILEMFDGWFKYHYFKNDLEPVRVNPFYMFGEQTIDSCGSTFERRPGGTAVGGLHR